MWHALEGVSRHMVCRLNSNLRRQVCVSSWKWIGVCLFAFHASVSARRNERWKNVICIEWAAQPLIVCQQTNTWHANQRDCLALCKYLACSESSHSSPFVVYRCLLRGHWFKFPLVFLWTFKPDCTRMWWRGRVFWVFVSNLSNLNSGLDCIYWDRLDTLIFCVCNQFYIHSSCDLITVAVILNSYQVGRLPLSGF